jgi:hypothetical protein
MGIHREIRNGGSTMAATNAHSALRLAELRRTQEIRPQMRAAEIVIE